jgi:type IV pilus assembly protein PilA
MNTKIRENSNKGFSLVELIVVIAIMAVLTSVLAPSLLAYVERSRAQKDDSAMSEVVNAVVLGLSDQDIYDEVLKATTTVPSCYIDGEHDGSAGLVMLKGNEASGVPETGSYFMFDASARVKDEQAWGFGGVIRGVTLTFMPTENIMTIGEGIINDLIAADAKESVAEEAANNPAAAVYDGKYMVADNIDAGSDLATAMPSLYYRLRATVGEAIELTSQTYRNSNYTVFIRMGSQGGTEASSQDAVNAHGQWCGTNLLADGTGLND